MAGYYLIWSMLFTSFSLLAAIDLVLTIQKAKRTKQTIGYIILESANILGYLYLLGELFSPVNVNGGFQTPLKYIVILLTAILWLFKAISIKKHQWHLSPLSLKDALKENQHLCFVFDNKGWVVQSSLGNLESCQWLSGLQNKADFLKACMENAYEEEFINDPQLKIKFYTEQVRKVIGFKREKITNPKGEPIGEVWTGDDITELQVIYEALKESQTELMEVQSVLVNYLEMVEDYERTKSEQEISLRMNEIIGHEMMTLLKQLQVMEMNLKEDDLSSFNQQLKTAILSCKDIIKDVRKTVQLISTNDGE